MKFGPNSSILALNIVSDTDAASYMVITIGFCNSLYSDSVMMIMNSLISVKSAPVGKLICVCENVELDAQVNGSTTVS